MLRTCVFLLFCVAASAWAAESPFGRALQVDSSAAGGAHKGEIRAVLEQPYAVVAPALAGAAQWCDILTLQVNIKRCNATADTLVAFITRKPRDTVESAHRVDFRYAAASSAEGLRVVLQAPSGPMGTRDYEIRLEAAPLDSRRTSLHLSYAYTLGPMARLAMDAYLAGPGRDKRGFTVDGGVRGVVERSAMRYYLAVETYLGSLGQPLETRLRRWHAAISQYPQLREVVGPDEYVEMKRREAGAG